MDEKERIVKVMELESYTPTTFAAEIGIQSSTLSHILNGRNKPSLDVLKKVLNRFRTINSDWLILGVGSMYRNSSHSQQSVLFDIKPEPSAENPNYGAEADAELSLFGAMENPRTVTHRSAAPHSSQSLPTNSGRMHQGGAMAAQRVVMQPETPRIEKTVSKVMIFYTDGTFDEIMHKA